MQTIAVDSHSIIVTHRGYFGFKFDGKNINLSTVYAPRITPMDTSEYEKNRAAERFVDGRGRPHRPREAPNIRN